VSQRSQVSGGPRYDVLVIGGYGHIGLPFGIALAESGLQVGLYDIDHEKGRLIAEGRMPFLEYDAEPMLQQVLGKTLHLARELSAVRESRALVITIGTPVDEYMNPKVMPILSLAEQLLPHLVRDQHIILRSTVFPRTSENVNQFFRERGASVHLAFCPERIAQGYAIRELRKLPQIISGFTPEAVDLSVELFRRLGLETVTVDVLEAELAKLFSNAWRYIQFAIANQFYMIAAENGVDFNRIHHAMTYSYDRADQFPTAGFAAGPCLLKDTMQLSAFNQNNFMLGQAAMLVNEGLPAFIVSELRRKFDLRREVVGILGMTFKADVDDVRDSLSFKLGKLLRFYGARVLCSDELARDPSFVSKEALVDESSIVVLAVPHSAYRTLVIPRRVHLVDLWGVFNRPSPI
jgi:UDP-N-acetyl-D-mannosaminuronic acid dehydrogenase